MSGFALALVLAALTPKEQLRFAFSIEQGADKSCGLAAAATLARVYWGDGTADEAALAVALPPAVAEGEISLADVAAALRARGFVARGYRMDASALHAALPERAPILVHLSWPQGHFSLVLAAEGRCFALADPIEGLCALDEHEFKRRFSGAALLVEKPEALRARNAIETAAASVFGRLKFLETMTP